MLIFIESAFRESRLVAIDLLNSGTMVDRYMIRCDANKISTYPVLLVYSF